MNLPYTAIVVLSVCAITFYRAGVYEKSSGMLWAALSIATSFLALGVFRWGLLGVLLAQLGLFVAITVYRMMKR